MMQGGYNNLDVATPSHWRPSWWEERNERSLRQHILSAERVLWIYPDVISHDPPRRMGHSCCYQNNCIYVFGGTTTGDAKVGDVWCFDFRTKRWTRIQTSGEEPGEIDGHTAFNIEGSMFVFGGARNGSEGLVEKCNALHILSLHTMRWSKPTVYGNLPAARDCHTANLIQHRSKVVIFGGRGSSPTYEYLQDVCVLDFESWTWSYPEVTGDVPRARESHTAATIRDCIYVFGGSSGNSDFHSDVHVLDVITFHWTKLEVVGSSPPPRAGHTCFVRRDKMYIFGGMGSRGTRYHDLWVMYTRFAVWTRIEARGAVPRPRFYHSVTVADHGVVIFHGGCSSVISSEVFLLDTQGNFETLHNAAILASYGYGNFYSCNCPGCNPPDFLRPALRQRQPLPPPPPPPAPAPPRVQPPPPQTSFSSRLRHLPLSSGAAGASSSNASGPSGPEPRKRRAAHPLPTDPIVSSEEHGEQSRRRIARDVLGAAERDSRPATREQRRATSGQRTGNPQPVNPAAARQVPNLHAASGPAAGQVSGFWVNPAEFLPQSRLCQYVWPLTSAVNWALNNRFRQDPLPTLPLQGTVVPATVDGTCEHGVYVSTRIGNRFFQGLLLPQTHPEGLFPLSARHLPGVTAVTTTLYVSGGGPFAGQPFPALPRGANFIRGIPMGGGPSTAAAPTGSVTSLPARTRGPSPQHRLMDYEGISIGRGNGIPEAGSGWRGNRIPAPVTGSATRLPIPVIDLTDDESTSGDVHGSSHVAFPHPRTSSGGFTNGSSQTAVMQARPYSQSDQASGFGSPVLGVSSSASRNVGAPGAGYGASEVDAIRRGAEARAEDDMEMSLSLRLPGQNGNSAQSPWRQRRQ